ncbi:MAG: CDP-alcohol phosphatidyltransferase family protein [Chloroflexi bacterium]|nr:CDP-alcohol phosphatidyltransferase family protein [Chloroflexota bacterium]
MPRLARARGWLQDRRASEQRPLPVAAWATFQASMPNLVTLLSLAAAILSLQALVRGDADLALRLILVCVLLDGMDGTLARQMRLTSPMGRQLDSLADLVAFGAAPATLLAAGPLGTEWPLATLSGAIFAGAGAFRLARYNLEEGRSGFSGLPITAAGGVLAALASIPLGLPEMAYALAALSLAALMVSRVHFESASSVRSRPSYLLLGGPIGLLGCIFLPGPVLAVIFGTVFGGYAVLGTAAAAWRHRPAPLRDRLGTF